ncbi:MAG: hypothetical protein ACQEQE_05560 [Bacillota bacterium]
MLEIIFGILILIAFFKLTFFVTSVVFKVIFGILGIMISFMILPFTIVFFLPIVLGVFIFVGLLKIIF